MARQRVSGHVPPADGTDRSQSGIPWSEIRAQAEQRFGITRFRPGQRELIETVLSGHDAFGILPTGAGKSLCYQLPALFLPGVVVVVSPLIALAQDQLDHLRVARIDAARLDSTVPARAQRDQERRLARGEHEIVLLTPERLRRPEHLLPLQQRGVALFVIDEAHCVSQWGHDFRPAYLELRNVIAELGRPPVLALTATAPPERVQDILESLGIPDARVVYTGIERDNLALEVFPTVNRDEKQRHLLALLEETPGAAILYAATVRRVSELQIWLAASGVQAVRYHGQLGRHERAQAQADFMSGACRLIVATSAFGLGVDKPDVRLVAHWNFPDSVESYYQEAGRAGRDGRPARCALLYRLEDKQVWSFLIGTKYPRADEARRVLRALDATDTALTRGELADRAGLAPARVDVLVSTLASMDALSRGTRVRLRRAMDPAERQRFAAGFELRYAADRARLASMMRYAETGDCRMRYLREYFGEPHGERCGRCDNCRRPLVESLAVRRARRAAVRTLARLEPPAFHAGQTVRHARFGTGTVVRSEGEHVTVAFVRGGERRVLAPYLATAR